MSRICIWLLISTCVFTASAENKACGHKRKREFAKTVIVTQMPFGTVYNLRDRDNGYLCRYVDNPLLVDTRMPLTWTSSRNAWYSREEFSRTCDDIISYGIDGFVSASQKPRYWFDLARERRTSGNCLNVTALQLKRPDCVSVAKAAVSDPNGLRHNGKAVLISYQCDRDYSSDALSEKLSELRRDCGGDFSFLIDVSGASDRKYQIAFQRNRQMPSDVVAVLKDMFRGYLRAADGIYIGETHMIYEVSTGMRRFDAGYYRAVVALLCEVLEEDEFRGKGKLLALSAINGHLNPSRIGFNTPEDGTLTLRKSFKVAMEANPDIIVLPEWDEYNENTCFAPTLCNASAVKRIVRYFSSKIHGEPFSTLQGDDTSRPNLIVSYRKSIAPGEIVDVEVLNVPDGTRTGALQCSMELVDESGQTLQTFPWREIAENDLSEARFVVASERLAEKARALGVRLLYRTAEEERKSIDGFCAIDLKLTGDWNVKCVKQPIRDIAGMQMSRVDLSEGEIDASLMADEPMHQVMLCENGQIRYLYSTDETSRKFRESDSHVVFAVSRSGWRGWRNRKAEYRVLGAPEAEWYRGAAVGHWMEGEICNRVNYLDWYPLAFYLRIPRSRLSEAEVVFDFPERYQGRVSLAEAYKMGSVADGGSGGTQFVVSRLDRSVFYPPPVATGSCAFRIRPVMDEPSTVCQVQVVTKSGRLWRSHPLVVEPGSGVCAARVWSAESESPQTVRLPASRVPRLAYDFSPEAGDVVRVKEGAWPRFWAMGGGTFVALPAAGNRGTLIAGGIRPGHSYYASAQDARPRHEKQADGTWALVFDGMDDFVSFPWGTIPRTAGFSISMDVLPETLSGRRLLFAARDSGLGSLRGIWIEADGRISVGYDGMKWEKTEETLDIRVQAGKWNHIVLKSRVDEIEVAVNGMSRRFPCVFPGRYSSTCMLGGAPPDSFFAGKVRNLVIDHQCSD